MIIPFWILSWFTEFGKTRKNSFRKKELVKQECIPVGCAPIACSPSVFCWGCIQCRGCIHWRVGCIQWGGGASTGECIQGTGVEPLKGVHPGGASWMHPTTCRQTDACKNITFPHTPYAVGNKICVNNMICSVRLIMNRPAWQWIKQITLYSVKQIRLCRAVLRHRQHHWSSPTGIYLYLLTVSCHTQFTVNSPCFQTTCHSWAVF